MSQKSLQEAIAYRRSVRVYDPNQPIDSDIVKECIRQATLAPTSSNLQLWEFYHVSQEDTKKALAKACLNQNAARTAQQFVVAVARKDKWKERAKANLVFLQKQFDQQEVRDSKRERMAKNYREI